MNYSKIYNLAKAYGYPKGYSRKRIDLQNFISSVEPLYRFTKNSVEIYFGNFSRGVKENILHNIPKKGNKFRLTNEDGLQYDAKTKNLWDVITTLADLAGPNPDYYIKIEPLKKEPLKIVIKKRSVTITFPANYMKHKPRIFEQLTREIPKLIKNSSRIIGVAVNKKITRKRLTKTNVIPTILEVLDNLSQQYNEPKEYHITIKDVNTKKSTLKKVGNFILENCVIAQIRSKCGDAIVQKIYEQRPELEPKGELIYITEEDIEWLAKKSKCTIECYTDLGILIQKPWFKYGSQKRILRLRISGGHAYLIPNKVLPINEAKYIDFEPDYIKKTKQYKSVLELTKDYFIIGTTIYKKFRPSIYTKNREDDQDPSLFRVHSTLSLFFRKLMGDIPDISKDIREELKQAELFSSRVLLSKPKGVTLNQDNIGLVRGSLPGTYIISDSDKSSDYIDFFDLDENIEGVENIPIGFTPQNAEESLLGLIFGVSPEKIREARQVEVQEEIQEPKVTELDHNKSYSSYKTYPGYIGFPYKGFFKYPYLVNSTDFKPAYIKVNNLIFTDTNYQNIFLAYYKKYPTLLTYPQYLDLLDFATIDIEYVLYCQFVDKDIVDLIPDDKHLRNKVLGKLIEGGIREERTITLTDLSNDEIDQIEYECYEEGIDFYELDIGLQIKLKRDRNYAKFHVHTYVLAYSQIQVLRKAYELSKHYRIVAMNIDSITIDGTPSLCSSNIIGGWKVGYQGKLKPHYQCLTISDPPLPNYNPQTIPPIFNRLNIVPSNRILLLGPGGIGKTRLVNLYMKQFDQICLTYTLALKHDIKKSFENTFTTQKYHQFTLSKRQKKYLPKLMESVNCIFEDECFMRSKSQWKKILRNNQIIITAGDECQICNDIEDAVDIEFFEKRGFQIVYMTRSDTESCRHDFAYGTFLDSLREYNYEGQKAIILENYEILTDIQTFDSNTLVIVGGHARGNLFNKMYKNHYKDHPEVKIRCRDRRNNISEQHLYDKKIWWGKKSMRDDIPQGKKYIPMFACTIDSVQGRTIEDETLILDIDYLTRYGTLYTAITRTRTADKVKLFKEK